MKKLQINVAGGIARLDTKGMVIVCGNSGYEIEFDFDSEWNLVEKKKARFVSNGKYEDVEFTGNICPVPVMYKTGAVEVGVYSEGANMSTTTGATIPCAPSIKCATDKPKPEYVATAAEQILAAADEVNGVKGQVSKNSWDIISIQKQLDVEVTEFGVIEGANERVPVPYGALKYAKIAELHGATSSYEAYESYTEFTKNFPARIVTDAGAVLFEMPSDAVMRLDNFGVVGNYVYFEDGKAYYKQTAKVASQSEYELAEGETWGAALNNYNSNIVILAEPIVTEISDYIAFDGIIDVGGVEYITVEPWRSEEFVKSEDERNNPDIINYEFVMPSTKFVFER